jgi:RNA polymerase sigma-70 factor (ECF subfamily)
VAELGAVGPVHDATVEALQDLLFQGARFEVDRRGTGRPELDDRDELARQAAADALAQVLERLDEFHGQSRFTTWALKFAVVEAGIKARRRAWRGRTVPPETAELPAAVQSAIRHDLSHHQRRVLVATAVNGVPIDVLAERLDTTRGALWQIVHDARRTLRAALAGRGPSAPELQAASEADGRHS